MSVLRCAVVMMVVCCGVTVWGGQEAPTARGFAADQVHQVADFDSVNAFNGNLTLTIPLGSATAGDRLKYGLTLSYNSNIWDYEYRCGVDMTWLWFSPISGVGPDTPLENCLLEALPSRTSNAGLGWTLSMGELLDWSTYVGPDGSQHTFYLDRGVGPEAYASAELYTRDGSYLRMRRGASHLNTPQDPNGQYARLIDFPNGETHEFACVAECKANPDREKQRYELRKMRDTLGNEVSVKRDPEPSTPTVGTLWKWKIQEKAEGGVSTEQAMTFRYNGQEPYRWVIDSVDLATAATSSPTAQYRFVYDHNVEVPRQGQHTASEALTEYQPGNLTGVRVPLLTKVVLPDGGSWSFGYAAPSGVTPPFQGRPYTTATMGGQLNRVVLPTGGGYEYEYNGYRYPRRDCLEGSMQFQKVHRAYGVRTRWQLDGNGQRRSSPWRYFPNTDFGVGDQQDQAQCDPSTEFRSLIVGPDGTATEHFFSIYIGNPSDGPWDPREYGLPVTKRIADPLNPGGDLTKQRYLSSRLYRCQASDFDMTQIGGETPGITLMGRVRRPETVCQSPVRETYVRYEFSDVPCTETDEWSAACTQVNRRMASERTVHHVVNDQQQGTAEIDSWSSTTSTDFDGWGHYREVRTNGNFGKKNYPNQGGGMRGEPAGDVKVSRTSYNAGRSDSSPPPPLSTPWLLGMHDSVVSWEESSSGEGTGGTGDDNLDTQFRAPVGNKATVKYRWDSATGRMTEMRKWEGLSESDKDVRITYGREPMADGAVALTERYYGGDLELPTAANPDYVIRRTVRYGSIEKVEYQSCSGETLMVVEENEIDPETGLTMSSTDAAGVKTTYGYNVRGQLAQSRRGDELLTEYTYAYSPDGAKCGGAEDTTPPRCASVTITRGDETSEIHFDHMGRVSVERGALPGANRWTYKQKTYDLSGRVLTESTTGGDGEAVFETRYKDYDAMGRPVKVVHADANSAEGKKTEYTYAGTRVVSRKVSGLALKPDGGASTTSSTTSETYDRQGRLVKVSEPAAGTANTPVTYRYDVLARLREVTAGVQIRTFTYDNRGFLTGETHPETGAIKYGNFDARGNYRDKYLNPGGERTAFDTTLVYDKLERVREMRQSRPGAASEDPTAENRNPRTLKTFDYYAATEAVGKRHQLKSTTRVNYAVTPTSAGTPLKMAVADSYDYNAAGHVSSQTLEVNRFRITASYGYDSRGVLQTVTYPVLQSSDWTNCATAGPSRVVTNEYTRGLLTKVKDGAREYGRMEYHSNGAMSQVEYGNGVKSLFARDGANLPRPAGITTTGAQGATFDMRDIRYDAAGNIERAGDDRFLYDRVGRLAQATMAGADGLPLTQTFEYDQYGNIKNFAGTDLAVQASTNRLSAATYDLGGNLTRWTDPRKPDQTYEYRYDAANMLTSSKGPGVAKVFLYTAGDERAAVIDYLSQPDYVEETVSFRGAGNQVLRDFVRQKTSCTWKDYIYRGTTAIAAIDKGTSNGDVVRYLHVDHLGSTRLITDSNRNAVDTMKFFAFGGEITSRSHGERKQFTGHERDDDGHNALWGDLDYMHARYYKMTLGRFFSVDPLLGDGRRPQSWNRYSYVRNNPLVNVDPDGRATWGIGATAGDLTVEVAAVDDVRGDKGVRVGAEFDPKVEASAEKLKLPFNSEIEFSSDQVSLKVLGFGVSFKKGEQVLSLGFMEVTRSTAEDMEGDPVRATVTGTAKLQVGNLKLKQELYPQVKPMTSKVTTGAGFGVGASAKGEATLNSTATWRSMDYIIKSHTGIVFPDQP